jgi:hypothetical protein
MDPRLHEPRKQGETAHDIGVGGTLQPDEMRGREDRPDNDPGGTTWTATEHGGVMVISAWPRGVAGAMVARVMMTTSGGTLFVRAVKGPGELHEVVDEWLAAMADT